MANGSDKTDKGAGAGTGTGLNLPVTRRQLVTGLGLTAGSMILASCGLLTKSGTSSSGSAPQVIKPVDTLKIAIAADPGRMHPWLDNGMPQFSTFWPQLYESVLWHDDKMNLVGGLAERWEVNGSDIKLALRKGVKFHNGKPLTGEAVKYAIEQITAPDSKSLWKSMIAAVTKVTVHDETTVTLSMEKPFRSVLMNLVVVALVEPDHARSVGEKLAVQPMGTGPYKFAEYVPGSHLILEANPDYYGPKPKTRRIHYRFITENGSRMSALESGEVHLINNVPPDQLERLSSKATLQILSSPTARSIYVAFRCDRAPWNDKRARQALNYAVDREAIVRSILRGKAQVANNPLAPMVLGGDVALPAYNYDPDKAKALLKEAGAEGASLTLGVPNGRYLMDKQVGEAIAGYLQKVGLKVTIDTPEWATYLAEVNKGPASKYDLAMSGWGVITMEPDYQLRAHYHSAFNKNRNSYTNAELDKAIDEAVLIMDRNQARTAYQSVLAKIWDESPWIWLYYQPDITGAAKGLQGFAPLPDEWYRFAQASLDS